MNQPDLVTTLLAELLLREYPAIAQVIASKHSRNLHPFIFKTPQTVQDITATIMSKSLNTVDSGRVADIVDRTLSEVYSLYLRWQEQSR